MKPEALEKDDFKPLPQAVLDYLPEWAPQPVHPCYANCPNKAALRLHCRRNAKLYPGYDKRENSGKGIPLQQFIKWVEKMDNQREVRINGIKLRGCNTQWVDPRSSNPKVTPRHALWVR